MALFDLAKPILFRLDPERAHRLTIAALKALPASRPPRFHPSLRTRVAGIDFPSPVGLAAGFDKNAEVAAAMLALGFGFVEVGTVTPRAQAGNARPRMFRLVEDRAVINRLGFNNQGLDAAEARLRAAGPVDGIVGVNVGANKDSADRIADYVEGVRRMAPLARYLTINISSPNTPGLRALQDEGALQALLAAVRGVDRGCPLFLKVAPDLDPADPERIVRAAVDHGVAALIVANTSVERPPLRSAHAGEQGGLSGQPLQPIALRALRAFRAAAGNSIPLIAAGGIGSAEDAWQRITAGASLVQLYTAMVFEGPGLARRIADGLARRCASAGFATIGEAVGSDA